MDLFLAASNEDSPRRESAAGLAYRMIPSRAWITIASGDCSTIDRKPECSFVREGGERGSRPDRFIDRDPSYRVLGEENIPENARLYCIASDNFPRLWNRRERITI
jgi:hypothetical protein